MKKRSSTISWFILILTVFSALVVMPKAYTISVNKGPIHINQTLYRPSFRVGSFGLRQDLDLKYGLDLAGGAHLKFSADTSSVAEEDKKPALDSLRENIEKRVNLFGVSEAVVYTSRESGQDRLIVELPGVVNVADAIALIGQTAQLEFKSEVDLPPEATASPTYYLDLFSHDTGLTGKHLIRSAVEYDPNTGQPTVGLQFDAEGTKLFGEITQANVGKRLAIFLDNAILQAPTVQEAIQGGRAVISGQFDTKTAKAVVAQLNAGALPVAITLIEQRQVGPTLGQDTIHKGLNAGMIGLGAVLVFMFLNYGFLGFIASLGLFVYSLLTLMLYKLIPVTLTFPGIVGLLLSIGMAVDSNILIFERFKEELRKGLPWSVALEQAFGRAWDSIRDANVATLITGFILLNPLRWSFLTSSGLVRGFAVTLVLGIFVSLFTGVVVTRNLLRVFAYKPHKLFFFGGSSKQND